MRALPVFSSLTLGAFMLLAVRLDAAPAAPAPPKAGEANATAKDFSPLQLALLMTQSMTAGDRVDALQAIAINRVHAEDHDGAQAVLQQALDLVKKLPLLDRRDALLQLAIAFADAGNSRQARLLMQQLPQAMRDGVRTSLALQLIKEDEFDEAILLVDQVQAEERESLLLALIPELSEKGEFDRAIALAKRMPDEARVHVLAGIVQVLVMKGQIARAITLAQQLPEEMRFAPLVGMIQPIAAKGQIEQALALAHQLPEDERIEALSMLVEFLASEAKVEPVLLVLVQLPIEIRRNATHSLVLALIEKGKFKDAIPMLGELRGSTQVSAHTQIARHHLRAKQPKEAAASIKQAELALADCKEDDRTEAMAALFGYHTYANDLPAAFAYFKQLPQEGRIDVLLHASELLMDEGPPAPKTVTALLREALPLAAVLKGEERTVAMGQIVAHYARAGEANQALALFVQLPKESQQQCHNELLNALVKTGEVDKAIALVSQHKPVEGEEELMSELMSALVAEGKTAKAAEIIKSIKDKEKRTACHQAVVTRLQSEGRTKDALAWLAQMPHSAEKNDLLLSLAQEITVSTPRAEALQLLWQSLDSLTKMSRSSRREGLLQLAPVPALYGNNPYTQEEAKVVGKIAALFSAPGKSK